MAVVALGSCAQPQPLPALQAVTFADLPGWGADRVAEAFPALRAECHRLALLPADTRLGGDGLAAERGGQAGQWGAACAAANAVAPRDEAASRGVIERWFEPYRVTAPALFTGYYEPEIQGSLTIGGRFSSPLLARPADLLQSAPAAADPNGPPVIGRMQGTHLVPYWSRQDIETGVIDTKARALAWADPLDAFFLQIQGAGRIRLADGSSLRVGFDGGNGRAYTPIGRVLVQQSALSADGVSMQSIRAWLVAHPAAARGVMDRNENYVFFRVLAGTDVASGPPGALGVDLQAGRSAAVDRHFIPLGAPVFVDTTDPVSKGGWQHLVMAQDIGTDIRGPARVDLFLGTGAAAEQVAGKMRQPGTAYILLPRG